MSSQSVSKLCASEGAGESSIVTALYQRYVTHVKPAWEVSVEPPLPCQNRNAPQDQMFLLVIHFWTKLGGNTQLKLLTQHQYWDAHDTSFG